MKIAGHIQRKRHVQKLPQLRRFLFGEAGAITVDWVVLSAALIGMGIVVVGATRSGMINLGNEINVTLSDANIVSVPELSTEGQREPDGSAGQNMPGETPVVENPTAHPEGTLDDNRGPIRMIERGPHGGRTPVSRGR